MSSLNFKKDIFDFESSKRKSAKKPLRPALFIGVLVAVIAVGTTFAATINLNSGSNIEFGQGLQQVVACSGNTPLTITPSTTGFVNTTGGGSYPFNSVTVSNIPSSCQGADFTIKAYGNSSSTPLALFNSTSTAAVVYDNAGTFQAGTGGTGMSVSSGSGTFTITFASPVATSDAVYKLTIQSGAHQ